MNKALAEKVLKAVERKYAKWIEFSRADGNTDPRDYPQLMADYDGAPYAVVWESNSPDEWAIRWGSAKREDPSGTFCEPIFSFVLGIYPDA
jgi:hypothetical protein